MFITWYALFSTLYLFAITLNFFFCKVLKLNKSFLDAFFFEIDYFFNFYSLLIATTTENNINTRSKQNIVTFKNLYRESNYFNESSIKSSNVNLNNIKDVIVFCTLNNNLFAKLPNYSIDLNYVSYISLKNFKSNNYSKKINLNFFFNRIININSLKADNLIKLKPTKIPYSNFKKKLILKQKKIILITDTIKDHVSSSWLIKFSPSNFIKYIDSLNLNKYNILYLRKSKVFNKGRYSRNRQYYRTGVYWCLYVNIIAVVGIYFWFYRFTMNFGYLWWLLYLFIASFIIPKAIKYRFYNVFTLLNSIFKDFLWLGYISFNILNKFKNFSKLITNFFNKHYLNFYYFNLTNETFYSKNTVRRAKNIIGSLGLLASLLISCKKLSIFGSLNVIHKWEFNNINYYYNSVIKSRPVPLEKFKQFFLRLFYIIFLSR